MSDTNNGGLVTVPRSTLEQLHAELSKTDAPQDMQIAGTLIVLERLLGIEPETFEIDEMLYASELELDKKRGFGI